MAVSAYFRFGERSKVAKTHFLHIGMYVTPLHSARSGQLVCCVSNVKQLTIKPIILVDKLAYCWCSIAVRMTNACTISGTGCRCYFDLSRYDCACCEVGCNVCYSGYQHTCVPTGRTDLCAVSTCVRITFNFSAVTPASLLNCTHQVVG